MNLYVFLLKHINITKYRTLCENETVRFKCQIHFQEVKPMLVRDVFYQRTQFQMANVLQDHLNDYVIAL